jgi:hypothetical protein
MGNHASRLRRDCEESLSALQPVRHGRRPSTRLANQSTPPPPRPETRRHRPQPTYTKDDLETTLQHMSAYLRRHKQNITILGSGSGWLVLKDYKFERGGLQYPGKNLTAKEIQWLKLALIDLEKHKMMRMQQGWFDDSNTVSFRPDLYKIITQQSIADENYLFRSVSGGLQVLCEPLEYTTCVKLDTIYKDYHSKNVCCPPHFKFEALDFLNSIVRKRGQAKLSFQEILEWGKRYGISVNERVLREVMEHGRVNQSLVMTDNKSGNKLLCWGFVPESLLIASRSNGNLIDYQQLSRVLPDI